LRGLFFSGCKTTAIYFKGKHAHNKSGPFVPGNKRMVADHSHRVTSRHVYGGGGITVRTELLRTSKSGPKKSYVPDTGCTIIERQKSIMEREDITLVNPDRFSHLASE